MTAGKVYHWVGTSAMYEVHALFAKPLKELVEISCLSRSGFFDDVRRFVDRAL